jgi:hypothetical protein
MKKIILAFLAISFLIGCTDKSPTQVTTTNKIKKTDCKIDIKYSFGIRESSFEGYRSGINFKIDTFPFPDHFNVVTCEVDGEVDSVNCDSIYQFWNSQIGKIWYDTSTCYYDSGSSRWLDTFYFQYKIIGAELN